MIELMETAVKDRLDMGFDENGLRTVGCGLGRDIPY